MNNKVVDLKNWTEATHGLFKYHLWHTFWLEILALSFAENDASIPNANLYIAGCWSTKEGTVRFERQLVAYNRHVLECLSKAREIIENTLVDGNPIELLRNAEKDNE